MKNSTWTENLLGMEPPRIDHVLVCTLSLLGIPSFALSSSKRILGAVI
jgi:hypothetical protein